MSILVLLTDLFDATGGIQTFNRALIKVLDKKAEDQGWEVFVFVLNDHGGGKGKNRYIKSDRIKYMPFKRKKLIFLLFAAWKALNVSTIIVGHVNFMPMVNLFRLSSVPKRILLTVHGIEVWKKMPFLKMAGIRKTDRFLSVSSFTKDRMAKLNSLDPSRFDYTPCTLDPFYGEESLRNSQEKLKLPKGKIILSVSRLCSFEDKGIDRVIRSLPLILKEVQNVFYVVVGDGDDRGRLEALARELGVDKNVIFRGQVPDQVLKEYYKVSDVFVLPSTGEGFGIVFLEAMYYGKPCVGMRAGGIPEVVEDGITGYLADLEEANSLAQKLIKLLRDEGLSRKMGEEGKKRLDRKFSYKMFFERLEAVLSK